MAIRGTLVTKFGEERECYIRINNVENAANHGISWQPRLRAYLVDFTIEASPPYVWASIEAGLEIECEVDLTIPKSSWDQMYEQIMVNKDFLNAVKGSVALI